MTGLRGRWWRSSYGAGCGIHALAIFVDLARQLIELMHLEVEEIDDVPCVPWSWRVARGPPTNEGVPRPPADAISITPVVKLRSCLQGCLSMSMRTSCRSSHMRISRRLVLLSTLAVGIVLGFFLFSALDMGR